MTAPSPTFGDLFKAKAITGDQVSATVAAYLADGTSPVEIGEHPVDIATAIEAHAPSQPTHRERDGRELRRRGWALPVKHSSGGD